MKVTVVMHPVSVDTRAAQINITTNPGSEGGAGLVPYQPGPHNSHHPPPVYYPQTPAHMADQPAAGMATAAVAPPPPPTASAATAGKPKSHQAQIVTEDPILDASGAVIGGNLTLISSTKYFCAMH